MNDDVDRLIAWLEEHRADIVRIHFGRVSFHFYGGGEIKVQVEQTLKLPPAANISES